MVPIALELYGEMSHSFTQNSPPASSTNKWPQNRDLFLPLYATSGNTCSTDTSVPEFTSQHNRGVERLLETLDLVEFGDSSYF